MRPLHLLGALGLVVIWGFNFVVTKVGLDAIPPITLCAIRFLLAAFPAVFFIKRPEIAWAALAVFGTVMFTVQFAFLYGGIALGLSAGLASIALQLHVFVTLALALALLGERAGLAQIAGCVLAVLGMVVVALHVGGDVSIPGLLSLIAAAFAWGVANILSKRLGRVDMLALVVWGSLMAPIPLAALALLLEGPTLILHSLSHLSWVGVGAIAYIVYPVTLMGFSFWSWLLDRYDAALVVPTTLLVPIVAMLSSALVLGEDMPGWKIAAAVLVCSGLAINLFGGRVAAMFVRAR